MSDREKVIRLIEEEISVCESVNQCYRTIDLPALRDILAVIKEQDQMYYTLEHDWRMCRKLLKEQAEEIERLKRPDCEHANHDGAGCLGYCGCEQDDEPIDACKQCEKYTGNICAEY